MKLELNDDKKDWQYYSVLDIELNSFINMMNRFKKEEDSSLSLRRLDHIIGKLNNINKFIAEKKENDFSKLFKY
ncbi:hypothetical protein [Clostridium sp.]|uniref:hypothetical protein n=1 Tax=Clostridium sp. TaxID=1506 RepID=UPI001B7C7EED|nr:hypothetical protein [Clostridium sp.]MBP3917160.1 hypothetical protein [Clostridium sp.]